MIQRFAIFAFIFLSLSFPVAAQYHIYLPVIFKSIPIFSPKKGVSAIPPYGCADAGAMGAAWYYDWQPAAGECDSAEFAPMVWGAKNFEETLATAVASAQPAGWLMGFNEPDYYRQANIDPTTAAILWRRIEAAAGDVRLVSPAPSQHDPAWLLRMATEYRRLYGRAPRFDALAVHVYESDAARMRRYIEARHREWPGLPVWVTEFNGCYVQSRPELMAEMIPWLEAQPWVARYAWFVSRPDANPDSWSSCTLLTTAGEMTPAGEMYRGF